MKFPTHLICFLLSINLLHSQSYKLEKNWWRPDGDVNDIVKDEVNDIVYLGGYFSKVGPHITYGTSIDRKTGIPDFEIPKPNASVFHSISDGKGGWYICGIFSMVGDSVRNNLAHIDSLGRVSPWNPNTNDIVRSIAISGSTLYAGGDFTFVSGQLRRKLAAFNLTTGALTSWNPNANGDVRSIAILDSTIYVAGEFSTIGGQNRDYIAALDSTTGSATSWIANVNRVVNALVIHDSIVYAGGDFSLINGQFRSRVAAIHARTGVIASWNARANDEILALAVSDSLIYLGGEFTRVDNQVRNKIAAINHQTGLLTSWNPKPNNDVHAITISDSILYVGGEFDSIGGKNRNYLAALSIDVDSATGWDPNPNKLVQTIAIFDSTIYVGGNFLSFDEIRRDRIVALDANTGTPTDWAPAIKGGFVQALALSQSGSTVYVGGNFDSIAGQSRNYIAALDATTGSPLVWNPEANNNVFSLSISGDTIYALGSFDTIGGQARNNVACLRLDTGLATSWNPNPNDFVRSILITDSVIYLGGDFDSIGGQNRNYIAALDPITGLSEPWNPDVNASVRALALVDTTLYVGGIFTAVGGKTRFRIAAISTNSGTATDWDPELNGWVRSIAVSDSTVYAAGSFNFIGSSPGGEFRDRLVAIDVETGLPKVWDPDVSNGINKLLLAGNTIYVGGSFVLVGDRVIYKFATFSRCFPQDKTDIRTACGSFKWIDGETYTVSNDTAKWTVIDTDGCETNFTLDLTIIPVFSSSINASSCSSFFWSQNGVTYDSSGIYDDTLTAANGCDSIVSLNLTINTPTSSRLNVTACDSFVWAQNGLTYDSTGIYLDTMINANARGCDSIVTLDLIITESNLATIHMMACDSFVWQQNGMTYDSTGVYLDTIVNSNSCDSIVALHLIINESNSSTINRIACDSFVWQQNGMTYDSTGVYLDTLANSNGCDSIVALNLIINESNSSTINRIACDSFVWQQNGMTYDTTGVYFDTLANSNGCDSIIALNLTINKSDLSTINRIACNSFVWQQNGMTYDSTGVYFDTLANSNGCDSVIALNLTINKSNLSIISRVACDSFMWEQNGLTYDTTGIYHDTLVNAFGCDSIINLDLTINHSSDSVINKAACNRYTWLQNGVTYTMTGVYMDTIVNTSGCDSIVTLDLTIDTIDNAIGLNGSVLTADQTGAAYQWFDCSGGNYVAINGATSQSYAVTLDGDYAVEVKLNSCTDTSTCVNVVLVGLAENDQQVENFKIYPNPTTGLIKVQFEEYGVDEELMYIYDLEGRIVGWKEVHNKVEELDLSELKNGLYIISYRGNWRKLVLTK